MKGYKLLIVFLCILVITGCNKINKKQEKSNNQNEKYSHIKKIDENITGNYIYVKNIQEEKTKDAVTNITFKFEENKCVSVLYEITYKNNKQAKKEYDNIKDNDVNFKNVSISNNVVKYDAITDGNINLTFYDVYISILSKYEIKNVSYK